MTEEEAFALDEYYTQNPPRVDPSKARIRIPVVRVEGGLKMKAASPPRNANDEYMAE